MGSISYIESKKRPCVGCEFKLPPIRTPWGEIVEDSGETPICNTCRSILNKTNHNHMNTTKEADLIKKIESIRQAEKEAHDKAEQEIRAEVESLKSALFE